MVTIRCFYTKIKMKALSNDECSVRITDLGAFNARINKNG